MTISMSFWLFMAFIMGIALFGYFMGYYTGRGP